MNWRTKCDGGSCGCALCTSILEILLPLVVVTGILKKKAFCTFHTGNDYEEKICNGRKSFTVLSLLLVIFFFSFVEFLQFLMLNLRLQKQVALHLPKCC